MRFVVLSLLVVLCLLVNASPIMAKTYDLGVHHDLGYQTKKKELSNSKNNRDNRSPASVPSTMAKVNPHDRSIEPRGANSSSENFNLLAPNRDVSCDSHFAGSSYNRETCTTRIFSF